MKFFVRLVLSLVLSGVFLWYAFRGVDLGQMWGHIQGVGVIHCFVFFAAIIVMHVFRTLRWGLLIRPLVPLSIGPLWRISTIGFMLIILLPLRLGEFARPYLLKREADVPMSAGLATVAMERVIDGMLVSLLFFVTTTQLGSQYPVPSLLTNAAWAALAIFAGAALAIVLALTTHGWFQNLLRSIGARFSEDVAEKVVGMLDAFVGGLRALPNWGAVAKVLLWTALYWGANGLGMYLMIRGFGWDLPVTSGFVLLCVLVIGIMIPAGPGFLGPYQAALILGLAVFGIGKAEALAYSMVAYVLTLGTQVGLGLPLLLRGDVQVRSIVDASSLEQGDG